MNAFKSGSQILVETRGLAELPVTYTHGRILAPKALCSTKLDGFDGTFAEKVDRVVPLPGKIRLLTTTSSKCHYRSE
jgi:hypothetical protein